MHFCALIAVTLIVALPLAQAAASNGEATKGVPPGFIAFFDRQDCPEGWSPFMSAAGRLVLSVSNPADAGVTLHQPLSDQEDRTHTHSYAVSGNLPSKSIATISCCDSQGASNGMLNAANLTAPHASGLPFTQLPLCLFNGGSNSTTVAFGSVGFFDPTVSSCPSNWTGMDAANGRFLIPGYEEGGTVDNVMAPLASGSDNTHGHSIAIGFSPNDVSFAAVEGCCDNSPASSAPVMLQGPAEANTPRIPYIQLLTCVSNDDTLALELPRGALIFNVAACPPGWELSLDVTGRYLVALPKDGMPGASFGGDSIPFNGSVQPKNHVHRHEVEGSVTLPATGVGAIDGCCGSGYAGAGTYPFSGHSSNGDAGFPFTMLPLCRQSA